MIRRRPAVPAGKCRVFWVADNGSSHCGLASIDRMAAAWPNAVLAHLPVHASRLNQVGEVGDNQAMASAEADNNTLEGREPAPGPVTNETELEPVHLIAMSDAASRMGALMLGAGTGSFRVLEAMRRVAAALGIDQLRAQVTLTHIVSTTTRQGIFRTQVVEVPAHGVNADRIAALETLSRSLPDGSSAAELDALLDEVEHRAALYGIRRLVLAAAVACAAFAFLNNGGWAECLVVFAAAACGRSAQLVMARRKINQFACVLVAAVIGCGVYVTITAGIRHLDPGAAGLHASAFTSSVLFLVPGFPLITAALDLARSDLAAGIQRLTYACLIIFSAGLGAWTVVAVTGVSPATAPVPAIGLAPLDALRLVAGFAGTFGFAVGFNTPLRFAVAAACIGSVANTARLTAIGLHLPQQFAAVGATFVVGVAAFFVSRYVRSPRIVLSVPAVLIMIPGAAAFRALVFLNDGQITLALTNGVQAGLIVASLAVGLALARIVTDRSWTLD
jgi:uncharacterized membrane protein YjjP (DUF1212 family)